LNRILSFVSGDAGKTVIAALPGHLRRATVCALAYVLVLQGFLFALGVVCPVAAQSASLTQFQLCSHDVSGEASPGTPPHSPLNDNHCPLCVAAAAYLDCAPALVPAWSQLAFRKAAWIPAPVRAVTLFAFAPAWPRGPPRAV